MSNDFVVKAAGPADAPLILEISQRAGGSTSPVGASLRAMRDPHRLVLVAEADGQLVGWAKTHFWDHADGPAPAGLYLGGVTVDPAWRRQGIATRLTQERLDWIWLRSHEAWAVVNAENDASIELHRHWGFTQVAEGSRFHTTSFTVGRGLLLRAQGPVG